MDDLIFITGMPRSGTTLLDKLLSMHKNLHILSQPLPLVFVEFKKNFLESIGNSVVDYPLNDMVFKNHYDMQTFVDFLTDEKKSMVDFNKLLKSMTNYSGQYTKIKLFDIDNHTATEQNLIEFIHLCLKQVVGKKNVIPGLKETFCEEYIPYFLRNNTKVIQILRDPRDVITSLNFGDSEKYAGVEKPILFHIRQWRKSVAFKIQYSDHKNYMDIKYENLVSTPDQELKKIMDFLDLPGFYKELSDRKILTQTNEVWSSNSSHKSSEKITSKSVGKYKGLMPTEDSNFIQACCYPEILLLNYKSTIIAEQIEDILFQYNEKNNLKRNTLQEYEWTKDRCLEEVNRFKMIKKGVFAPEIFLFEKTFKKMLSLPAF